MKAKNIGSAFVLAAVLALLGPAVSATASTGEEGMQQRIDTVLETHPDAVQTAWNEVAWEGGDVTLTLASGLINPSARASVGGCASGKFCAYNQTGYRGDKLSFSSCTASHSVSSLAGAVRSIANSRSSGTVRAYAGSTVLASASAGTGSNVTGTSTKLSCG